MGLIRETYAFTCGSYPHMLSPTFLPNCGSSLSPGLYSLFSTIWAEQGICKHGLALLMHLLIHWYLLWSFSIRAFVIDSLPGHIPSLMARLGICLHVSWLPRHCPYPGGLLSSHVWAIQSCSLCPLFFWPMLASPPSHFIHSFLWLHTLGHFLELLHLRIHKIHTSHSLTTAFLSLQSPSLFSAFSLSNSLASSSLSYTICCSVFTLIPLCTNSTVITATAPWTSMPLFNCLLVTHISQLNPEGFQSSAISAPHPGCWDSVKGQISSSLQIKVSVQSWEWTSQQMSQCSVPTYYMLLCFSGFLRVLQEIFQIFSSVFQI